MLFFNAPPAKVFMGDGASASLGFSFAALPLLVAQPTPADIWLKLNLGALILFPFLFDGTFTLIPRAYFILCNKTTTKNPPIADKIIDLAKPRTPTISHQQSAIGNLARLSELTQAHRSHLYQRWVQSGASHRKVASAYPA